MSVKGIVQIAGIKADSTSPGMVELTLSLSGLDPAIPYGPVGINLFGVDPTTTSAFIGNQVEQYCQSYLITNAGYTFGAADHVRLIGVV